MGQNTIDLKDRVAIVTGGAQGLGFAIAERLAQSGATIAVWDINQDASDEAAEKLGGGAAGIVCNVADEGSVADALAATKDKLGKIDITVNNAGISGPNTTSWEYPADEWRINFPCPTRFVERQIHIASILRIEDIDAPARRSAFVGDLLR